MLVSGRDVDTPSTTTASDVPSLPTEIVCAASSVRAIAHADGGESPLLVFAHGSGVEPVVPAGAVVAPSDCVVGVEPATAPVVEPPVLAPGVPVVPAALCASVVVPQTGASEVVVLCVPVGCGASVVLGAVTELVSVPVGSLVVVTVVVVVSLGAAMVLLSVPPMTAVSTGGVDVASESELPDESVPDCGDVTVVGSGDVIVVSLDTTVLVSDDEEAVPSVALGGAVSEADCSRRAPVSVAAAVALSPVVETDDWSAGGVVAVGDVVEAGAAGVCGADGIVTTGAPTVSVTTGRPANRSTGMFVGAIPVAPVSE
jgi:hypothetical protein